MSTSPFFVYEDWTLEAEPRCFYVGKGRQKRINYKYRNKKHAAVSTKYGVDRRVVLETTDESEALALEVSLIRERDTFMSDLGCNFTAGGEGVSAPSHRKGKTISEQHRKNISEGKKGKPTHWSRPRTPEFKARISQALTGISRSEETRRKVSLSLKGRPCRGRMVCKLDSLGVCVDIYRTLALACENVGTTSRVLIRECCNGARPEAYGFKWRWV
jgi:hypothetical protein